MMIEEFDTVYQNQLYDIIYEYDGESRLLMLKQYMLTTDYFKNFGYDVCRLAYSVYVESLKLG